MEHGLIDTFLEEYEGGIEQFSKSRFKNSIILLSKSLFALCDLIIHKKTGRLPSNHTERFRIMEEYYPDIYHILDRIFDKYTDSYSKPVLKGSCEMIKNAIRQISKNPEIPERIKEYTEKI